MPLTDYADAGTKLEQELKVPHMNESLASKQCIPCRGGVPALDVAVQEQLFLELVGWELVNHHHLAKEFSFPNFKSSLAFVNKVGALAEEQNHHPNFFLTTRSVRLEIWTHKIDGLTESDFVLAAKIDQL